MKKVPVVIINGFLGSGKTTLLRNLLSQSKRKNLSVCAIVNDMSKLDIDGELISNITAVEENKKIFKSISSYVLSSKDGIKKLNQSITALLNDNKPDIIIIETSGGCHPMPLIKYFKCHKKTKLTGVLVLIDGSMIANDFDYGKNLIPKIQENMVQGVRESIDLLVEQILFCSHLIITKVDKLKSLQTQYIVNEIKKINPFASLHSIVFGKLSIDSLFEINEYDYFAVEKLIKELEPILITEENTESPYNLATEIIKDDRPFHPQRLWDVCHKFLDKRIYRSKGFFWLASRNSDSLLWNQAAGSINLELIGTWRAAIINDKNNGLLKEELKLIENKLKKEDGRFGDRCCDLTIIGHKNHVVQFSDKLKSCFLTDEEITNWQNGTKFKDPWPQKILRIKN
tara:strand:+ start:18689 stop:19885 length:1197 start_codon:yes stop_codon:yes gene_type:complete